MEVTAWASKGGTPLPPTRRWGSEVAERRADDAPRTWHARVIGFDLHAAVAVRASARDRLEPMCCAGRMTLVALIRDPAVVGRILRHLGLPDAVPVPRAGRAPRLPWETDAEPEWSGVG